jgi:hypothetical protein
MVFCLGLEALSGANLAPPTLQRLTWRRRDKIDVNEE